MAVAEIVDEGLIGGYLVAKFSNRAQQLLPLKADLFAFEHCLQPIHQPQRLIDVAVNKCHETVKKVGATPPGIVVAALNSGSAFR